MQLKMLNVMLDSGSNSGLSLDLNVGSTQEQAPARIEPTVNPPPLILEEISSALSFTELTRVDNAELSMAPSMPIIRPTVVIPSDLNVTLPPPLPTRQQAIMRSSIFASERLASEPLPPPAPSVNHPPYPVEDTILEENIIPWSATVEDEEEEEQEQGERDVRSFVSHARLSMQRSNFGYQIYTNSGAVKPREFEPFRFSIDEHEKERALLFELEQLQGLDTNNIPNMQQLHLGSPKERLNLDNNPYQFSRCRGSMDSNEGSLEPSLSEKLTAFHYEQTRPETTYEYHYKTHNFRVNDQLVRMRIGLLNARWENKDEVTEKNHPSIKMLNKIPSILKRAGSKLFVSSGYAQKQTA